MKTRILPLALLAAAAAGCTNEDEASVQFYAVCFPPAPDTTTGLCAYPSACDAVALGNFWADVSAVGEGVAPIEIRNQLPDNSDPSTGRLNTNTAYINQFRFETHLSGTDLLLPEAWVDANVTVPTSGTTVALVPVLPRGVADFLRVISAPPPAGTGFTYGHLMVFVRAVGKFADERRFETGPFKVAVDACAGCATFYNCDDPTTPKVEQTFYCPQPGQYSVFKCQ